jgi:DNA-binding response OmpR family regulator
METNLTGSTEAKVLIVDDEKDFCEILFRVVKQAGFTTLVANDGPMALEMIRVDSPDIVLLDIRMPGIDGFEVIRRLKEQEESRDIPIIFISASTEVKQRIEALKLGAVDFITKPFQHEELLVRVQTHLELSRLRSRLQHQTDDLTLANEKLRNEISKRKRLEDERMEMERKLLQARKLESLAIMAGGIAHDFNNQLAVVLGNLELALMDRVLDPKAREQIENAITAAKRSAELSRQMQIYAGNTLYDAVDLDLNELLNKKPSLLQLCVSKYANLNLDIYSKLPPIKGDADQILRLVMNLVVNASEAIGDQHGEVTLATGVMDCDAEYLSRSRPEDKPGPGRFVFLEITDTGCGMDSWTLDRLFDPFFSTKFWGRGLGMAEVIGIIKGHHGAIVVESESGKGTTIRVLFPVPKEVQESSVTDKERVETKSPESGAVNRRKTILIVEDEAGVSNLAVKRLDLLGYDTIIAADGEEGVRVFRERLNEIDLVMPDFKMPKMTGADLSSELVKIRPDIPVILCTGFSETLEESELSQWGIRKLIRKPILKINIARAIRESLE